MTANPMHDHDAAQLALVANAIRGWSDTDTLQRLVRVAVRQCREQGVDPFEYLEPEWLETETISRIARRKQP